MLKFEKFSVIHKARDENMNGGGGVALLIDKNLKHCALQIETEEEIKGVEIYLDNKKMNLFTKYVPPNKMLPINLLEELNVKYENTIVMGDLNAKIGEIGGKTTNRNGELLTYLLETTSLMIVVSVISGMFLGLFKP